MSKDFATRLRKHRKELKLTQEDMAEHLSISRRSYGLYELGKTLPNTEKIQKISSILRVSSDWLVSGEEHLYDKPPSSEVPLIGLASCGVQNWFTPIAENTYLPTPPDFEDPDGFAVVAIGTSLQPEGVRAGFVCYCAPNEKHAHQDIVYIETKQAQSSLKVYLHENEEWITVLGYLPPDANGDQKPYKESKRKSEIKRLAPVIYIKRKR